MSAGARCAANLTSRWCDVARSFMALRWSDIDLALCVAAATQSCIANDLSKGRMMARVRRTGIALLGAAVMACRPAPGAFSVTKTQDRTVLSQALPAMD